MSLSFMYLHQILYERLFVNLEWQALATTASFFFFFFLVTMVDLQLLQIGHLEEHTYTAGPTLRNIRKLTPWASVSRVLQVPVIIHIN